VPELPEVERYRALADARVVGRVISSVGAPDSWYLKHGTTAPDLAGAVTGQTVQAARRRGKLLLVDVGRDGHRNAVLGLHFGMSGRLLVDDTAGVDRLLHGPVVDDQRYDRFWLQFNDGGRLVMRDPRRLGGVQLDPDESRLGPDALDVTVAELRAALAGAAVPLKALLLDQSKLAGVGNLIADEILWRSSLDPARPAGGLSARAVGRLHGQLASGLAELMARGGSHTGDLQPERRPGGRCPRDGTELRRATVGGRTTFWCPKHQK
jgi:formamidopyrimidine-DNA glycosylase